MTKRTLVVGVVAGAAAGLAMAAAEMVYGWASSAHTAWDAPMVRAPAINTPEDRLFTTSLISPLWVWWIAHLALGTTMGLVYMLLERRAPATAMPRRAQVVPVEPTRNAVGAAADEGDPAPVG